MSATVEITNDIALIRMDDGKANAINFEMVAALNTALDMAGARGDYRQRPAIEPQQQFRAGIEQFIHAVRAETGKGL